MILDKPCVNPLIINTIAEYFSLKLLFPVPETQFETALFLLRQIIQQPITSSDRFQSLAYHTNKINQHVLVL